jgi:hypothetical protein
LAIQDSFRSGGHQLAASEVGINREHLNELAHEYQHYVSSAGDPLGELLRKEDCERALETYCARREQMEVELQEEHGGTSGVSCISRPWWEPWIAWTCHLRSPTLLLFFLPSAYARPSGPMHTGNNQRLSGIDNPIWTCIMVPAAFIMLHKAVRNHMNPEDHMFFALTLSGVVSLLWWIMFTTSESFNDLATPGCCLVAAYFSLLDGCARRLHQRYQLQFLAASVFIGGGVPLIVASSLNIAGFGSAGWETDLIWEIVFPASPLYLVCWTWMVFTAAHFRQRRKLRPDKEKEKEKDPETDKEEV